MNGNKRNCNLEGNDHAEADISEVGWKVELVGGVN
jgi:hypothetical protein